MITWHWLQEYKIKDVAGTLPSPEDAALLPEFKWLKDKQKHIIQTSYIWVKKILEKVK